MLEVCSGVTNEKEKDGGYKRSVGLWFEGSRVTRTLLCAKCSSIWSWFESGGSIVVY